mmetsp:Transcript_43997/g.141050  ORF Transcript_43997/g.141050 Transcript_43997/m.141050 type:complete len:990 (-) Transcript_43997:60-3029(-)
MAEAYFVSAYVDMKEIVPSAALQILREGLQAYPTSSELLELARKDGIEVPTAPTSRKPLNPFDFGPAARPTAAEPEPEAPLAPVSGPRVWKPPRTASSALEVDAGDAGVRAFREAQKTHAVFAEAAPSDWSKARRSTEALHAEEHRLRAAGYQALQKCKALMHQRRLEFREELFRSPSSPDIATRVHDAAAAAANGGALESGVDGALRAEARWEGSPFWDAPGRWSAEGPGAQLKVLRAQSETDALPSRAKDLARTGPGSLHKVLSALARETEAAMQQLKSDSAQVLVLGGHGASAVAAARAGARHVFVFEPRRFVACAAREVLRRNLSPAEFGRCVVSEQLPAPPSVSGGIAWHLVVVELWTGGSAFSSGPLEALSQVAERACCGSTRGAVQRVVPAGLQVEVSLADGRLASVSGFDLSFMDSRYRGVSTQALHIADGQASEAHPTALKPVQLTDRAVAFELDLGAIANGKGLPSAGSSRALELKGCSSGRATLAAIAVRFQLAPGADFGSASLCYGQWLTGGLTIRAGEPVAGVSARLGFGNCWVDWDWASSEEAPFGYMVLSDWYFEMLRDGARHDLYDAALRAEIAAVRKRKGEKAPIRVLDVGSGDGILSMMALRAGASAVVGVEHVSSIARASEDIVRANRRSAAGPSAPLPSEEEAPLEVWCTDVRGVTPPEDEELKFDVLVSELMDASGLGENLVCLTEGARRRLCREGTAVIPARLRLSAVLCEVRMPDIAGTNMDAFWPLWPSEKTSETLWLGVDLDKGEGDFKVLTKPVELFTLELGVAQATDIPTKKPLHFEGMSAGRANFVVWWFETQLSTTDPSIVLTNAPKCVDGRHTATCWGQAAAEVHGEVAVEPGATVEVQMDIPFGDYQLRFRRPGATLRKAGSQANSAPDAPPGAKPYSEEFAQDWKAYNTVLKQDLPELIRAHPIGLAAGRADDFLGICAIQRCALAIAAQPRLFGVEPCTIARYVHALYAVGGEGRS